MNTAFSPMPAQHIVAREGFPFLFVALVPAAVFAILGWWIAFVPFAGIAVFVACFFRNPERLAPEDPDAVIAPADGKIIAIDALDKAPFIDCPGTKVSIFMSIFNVHINRMPISAVVRDVVYRSGKFLVASLDKASEHNERNIFILEGEGGRRLAVVQIAGLIARRIVCYLKPGDKRSAGERVGLIRFGSRVDLYIPSPHSIQVKNGDTVRAGETIIGRWA